MLEVDHPPHFHIAVPYLDGEGQRERLQLTLDSVLGQYAICFARARLTLTVAAGGDGDGLASWLQERHPQVGLDHADDRSMYEALARVFRSSDADFFGWLGAGDAYESTAFDIVLENAPARHAPYWITGLMRGRRTDGTIVRSFLHYRYRRNYFDAGLHGTVLPSIQQESTLWNRTLHRQIDFDEWSRFQLAGDFYLWKSFSRHCEPVVVEAAIGSFRWHGDNRSSDYAGYMHEVASITRSPRVWERVAARGERVLWGLPPAVKARLSRGAVRRYSWPNGPWE